MNTELIGQTWDKLADRQKELGRTFFTQLFEQFPQYKPLFSETLDRQLDKIIETMAMVARIANDTEVLHPKMIKLGMKHSQFKLNKEDLQNFKQVFLDVLTSFCLETWTEERRQAWEEVFDQRIIPYMVEGLKQPEPKAQTFTDIKKRTSVRNQLLGTVLHIKPRMYHAEVMLKLMGGQELMAILTLDSINRLGLTEGSQAHVLIRAPHLILVRENCQLKFSATNYLCGKVVEIQQARLNTEVTLELQGGDLLKAMVFTESVEDLGIKFGERFCGILKASNVVLAVEE